MTYYTRMGPFLKYDESLVDRDERGRFSGNGGKMGNKTWEAAYEGMVGSAMDRWAADSSALARSGKFPSFKLFYRPTRGSRYGELSLVPESKKPTGGWKLAPEPNTIKRGHTRAQVESFVRQQSRRLPILVPIGKLKE